MGGPGFATRKVRRKQGGKGEEEEVTGFFRTIRLLPLLPSFPPRESLSSARDRRRGPVVHVGRSVTVRQRRRFERFAAIAARGACCLTPTNRSQTAATPAVSMASNRSAPVRSSIMPPPKRAPRRARFLPSRFVLQVALGALVVLTLIASMVSCAASPSPPRASARPRAPSSSSGLFATGVDSSGTPLAAGAVDPHYTLSSDDRGAPGPERALGRARHRLGRQHARARRGSARRRTRSARPRQLHVHDHVHARRRRPDHGHALGHVGLRRLVRR